MGKDKEKKDQNTSQDTPDINQRDSSEVYSDMTASDIPAGLRNTDEELTEKDQGRGESDQENM